MIAAYPERLRSARAAVADTADARLVALWRAVVAAAFWDAIGACNPRWRETSEQHDARRWLCFPSAALDEVCDLADLVPGDVIAAARRMDREGWKRLPNLSGGRKPADHVEPIDETRKVELDMRDFGFIDGTETPKSVRDALAENDDELRCVSPDDAPTGEGAAGERSAA